MNLDSPDTATMKQVALDGIITTDGTGSIRNTNPAAEALFGRSKPEMVGRSMGELLIAPVDRERFAQGLGATGVDGRIVGRRVELMGLRADGSTVPIEVTTTAVAGTGSSTSRLVIYVRDITDRRAAAAESSKAAKLALVASRTDNAVIITDDRGLIEWANEGFTRVTGYRLDEVMGKKPGTFLQGPETDPSTVKFVREKIAAGEGFRTEIKNYGKSGRDYWLAMDVQPIRDSGGRITNFVAIESDVTARKEAELAQAEAKLAAESAREAAQAASRAKSEFLANMSHEIRTPLNGVVGMIELLDATKLDDQQRHYAGILRSSADALLSLINDILDFSKIEAGKLELETTDFNLERVVEEAVQMLAPRAAKKGLQLAGRVDPAAGRWFRGDPARIRQIVFNLINNAVKFTEAGGVTVTVVPDEQPGLIRVDVTDTGIGIPTDRMNRLFKSFSQVDASTTRRYGGTGLGLIISKQLAELMGGRIGVQSTVGKGSTFWFTLKLAATEGAGAGPADRSLTGLPVLVADANAPHRELLKDMLQSWGMTATAVDSAAAAVSILEARPFQVVICDAELAGWATIKSAAPAAAAVLAMTAVDRAITPADAAGFDAVLQKPVLQSTLYNLIQSRIHGTVAVASAMTPVVATESPAETHGGRILVADDNDINQIVAQELLRRGGYQSDVVSDGRAAVEAVATGRYTVVLMDCQMPEMDGFEASRLIRKNQRAGGPAVTIIALTANAVKGDREQCLAAGMDDYLPKPLNPRELFGKLEHHQSTAALAA